MSKNKKIYYKKENGRYVVIDKIDEWKIARPFLVNNILEICDTIFTIDEKLKGLKNGEEREIL